jgi:hypothetical protein
MFQALLCKGVSQNNVPLKSNIIPEYFITEWLDGFGFMYAKVEKER